MRTWLKPAEVAERFCVSKATIYRALREGRLPGIYVLGCWRIDPDELEEWIASHRTVPRPRTTRDELMADVIALRRSDAAI